MGKAGGTTETRARILAGGQEALGVRGIQATTVEDILQAAGVSRRTFYQYFQSKEGLLQALYEEAMDRLILAVQGAVSDVEDGAGKIRASIQAYLDFQLAGGPLLIQMQADAIRHDSRVMEKREQTLDALVQIVGENVQSVLQQDLDPLIYRALLIGIEGLIIHCQADGSFDEEDSARVGGIAIPMLFSVLASFEHLPKRNA
jgi:AcrR family transcriptional regulator